MSQQIELSERQEQVVKALAERKQAVSRNTPVTAALVAASLGVDSRGVGQTLRRLRDNDGLVAGPDDDGGYKFTAKGRGVAQRLANQQSQPAAA